MLALSATDAPAEVTAKRQCRAGGGGGGERSDIQRRDQPPEVGRSHEHRSNEGALPAAEPAASSRGLERNYVQRCDQEVQTVHHLALPVRDYLAELNRLRSACPVLQEHAARLETELRKSRQDCAAWRAQLLESEQGRRRDIARVLEASGRVASRAMWPYMSLARLSVSSVWRSVGACV